MNEIKCIEISIAYDDGIPEHYGYYYTIQEAMDALLEIEDEETSSS